MKNFSLFSASLAFAAVMTLSARPAEASSANVLLEQRLKASFNTMVQDVRKAEDPAAKREIMTRFLGRLDKGLALVETMTPANEDSHVKAAEVRAKVRADVNELNALNIQGQGSANTLNAYASFLQQDVEQADGVYLSVGALIIILLILIILL